MVAVEIVRLPPEIASMLMVRNRETIPLCWQNQPNRRGRNALDEMTDERLFGAAPIVDDNMKAAVRALLYLWNGYPDEAKKHAQPAPPQERLYLSALADRMLGHWRSAEELFNQLPSQPFLPILLNCAKETCTACGNQLIVTVQEAIEQLQQWDHLLFVFLFQQAATGQIGLAGEQVVSQIQYSEFELVFSHCYEEAAGTRVLIETRKQAESAAARTRRKETSKKPSSCRLQRAGVMAAESKPGTRVIGGSNRRSQSPASPPATDDSCSFRVSCPSCGASIMLPSNARGNKNKCSRCGGLFMAGRKELPVSGSASGRPANSTVVVCCPICQTMHDVPLSARGTNRRCSRCGTVFSVGAK